MLRCGLLGEKLGHSYSPRIHHELGNYEYLLYEKSPDELGSFLTSQSFDGLNVTIPYKKAVIPYCKELSPTAQRMGSVNTIVRRSDGTLYGDNTDAMGFTAMVQQSGIEISGKKALVLGTGGAALTVRTCLQQMGASAVVMISRSGPDNYDNLDRHADAQIIVNATPVGMYPHTGVAPLSLSLFPHCEGVLDVVYNPARTALILEAEALKIPCCSGLYMLVAQAAGSSEQFTGRMIPPTEIQRIERMLRRQMENIVLVGMPGSGKSTVARKLAEVLNRPVFDSDAWVEEQAGMSIPEIFRTQGEDAFRQWETKALAQLGKGSGAILSTGGGCVMREENYPLLHQNGVIIQIKCDTKKLARKGRPLSQGSDLDQMAAIRAPHYARFADYIVDNNGKLENTIQQILEVLK